MASPRIRDVADKKEMDRVIDDFQTQNYVIKEQGTSTTLLKEKSWGSAAGWIVTLVVAVILAIFTFGFSFIIPIAYAIYAHYNSKEVLLRIPQ
jgi:hypothetical protein